MAKETGLENGILVEMDTFTFEVQHLGYEKEYAVESMSREGAWLKLIEKLQSKNHTSLGLTLRISLIKHELGQAVEHHRDGRGYGDGA